MTRDGTGGADDQADCDGGSGSSDGNPDRPGGISSRPAWPVHQERTEYETGWYTGGYDEVEQPDGSTKRYYWAALPPAAVVVAKHRDHLLMVEQYRPTIRERCLELPAGIVEDEETFTEAGARELAEETGFAADEVELLESYWCATGVLRHQRGIVFASDLSPVDRQLDDNEFLSVVRVPIGEALQGARTDPANDATIEGILIARADGRL